MRCEDAARFSDETAALVQLMIEILPALWQQFRMDSHRSALFGKAKARVQKNLPLGIRGLLVQIEQRFE